MLHKHPFVNILIFWCYYLFRRESIKNKRIYMFCNLNVGYYISFPKCKSNF